MEMAPADAPRTAGAGESKELGLVFRPPHLLFSHRNDEAVAVGLGKLGLDEKEVVLGKRNEGLGEVERVERDEEGTVGSVDAEKIPAASASKDEGGGCKRNDDTDGRRVEMWEVVGGEQGTEGGVDAEKISALPSKGDDEDGEKAENNRTEFPYPQRPGLLNCAYYMRTGICGFGANCKFNHPPRTKSIQKLDHEDEKELPGKVGLIECKYFSTPEGCKFGNACKFSHSKEISQTTEIAGIKLNFVGLPIRPGQKECPYYMRTGECKFSSNCRFNHPDPSMERSQDFVRRWENGESSEPYASAEMNMPNILFPPKGLNYKRNFMSQVPQNTFPPSGDNIRQSSFATLVGNTNVVHHVADKVYPERPGQPECSYYMKTGDCKFGFACKFHHPRSRLMGTSTSSVGPLGLPSRPDQPICSFYSRFGLCKFGPSCKFDHPVGFAGPSPATASSRLV